MKFYTYNGVFAEEKKLGQKLEIDVDMQYPIEERVQHDDLNEIYFSIKILHRARVRYSGCIEF